MDWVHRISAMQTVVARQAALAMVKYKHPELHQLVQSRLQYLGLIPRGETKPNDHSA